MRAWPETLAWARRELTALRHINQRLQRQMMRSGQYEPRKVFRVDRKALRHLSAEIAALPKRRRIRAEQARRLIRQICGLTGGNGASRHRQGATSTETDPLPCPPWERDVGQPQHGERTGPAIRMAALSQRRARGRCSRLGYGPEKKSGLAPG